jgi:nicotinamide mononucleotide transporter
VGEILGRVSLLEAAAVALAVAYLVLAIRQNIWCWPAAFVSSVLSIFLFFDARLFMESGLQVFYAVMAIYGWYAWTGRGDGSGALVHVWSWQRHAGVVAAILAASGLLAWLLARTSQVMPFVDSFTTVAAVVTTYMVARKVLENWIYWFVIDSVSIYMYLSRDLWLYAALFVVYLVLVVVGFRQWHADWRVRAIAETGDAHG